MCMKVEFNLILFQFATTKLHDTKVRFNFLGASGMMSKNKKKTSIMINNDAYVFK